MRLAVILQCLAVTEWLTEELLRLLHFSVRLRLLRIEGMAIVSPQVNKENGQLIKVST